jgi:hypothetical protein
MPKYLVRFECEIALEAENEDEARMEAWSVFEEDFLVSHVSLFDSEDDDPEVCSGCGGDNLMWDAYVDGKGEVISTFDNVECGDCGDQTRAIPLSEFEENEENN